MAPVLAFRTYALVPKRFHYPFNSLPCLPFERFGAVTELCLKPEATAYRLLNRLLGGSKLLTKLENLMTLN
jgi:hypothetical protein